MTNTDGIFDTCRCGERPNILQYRRGPFGIRDYWTVNCDSCGASTGAQECVSDAMVTWNKLQRNIGTKEP